MSDQDSTASRTDIVRGETRMRLPFIAFLITVFLTGLVASAFCHPQEDRARIDKSRIPAEGDNVNSFVPPGWKIEEKTSGDLNGDALPDFALKLVEDKPARDGDGVPTERQRALVIVLVNQSGKLSRAAVTDTLLQCTNCGGAFYGMTLTPSEVKIEKGVLVVSQDHGSREVTSTTFRFRYEPESGRFVLIGFDIASADRATGDTVSESTNYLTGARVTTHGRGNRNLTSHQLVTKEKVYLEQVDSEKLEAAAAERLHL
jgi:hypothetical protein